MRLTNPVTIGRSRPIQPRFGPIVCPQCHGSERWRCSLCGGKRTIIVPVGAYAVIVAQMIARGALP